MTIIQRGVEERRTPGTVRPDCLLALDRSLCARHSRTRTSVSNPSRSPRPAIHSESGHPNEETTRRAYDSAGPSGDVWVDRRQRIEVNSFASENYAIEVARAHFEAETTRRSHETLSWLPPPKLLAEHPLEVGSSDKPAVSLRRSLRIPQFDGLRVLKSRNPQSGFNSVDGGDQFRKLVRQGQVVDLAAHCRWAKRATTHRLVSRERSVRPNRGYGVFALWDRYVRWIQVQIGLVEPRGFEPLTFRLPV